MKNEYMFDDNRTIDLTIMMESSEPISLYDFKQVWKNSTTLEYN